MHEWRRRSCTVRTLAGRRSSFRCVNNREHDSVRRELIRERAALRGFEGWSRSEVRPQLRLGRRSCVRSRLWGRNGPPRERRTECCRSRLESSGAQLFRNVADFDLRYFVALPLSQQFVQPLDRSPTAYPDAPQDGRCHRSLCVHSFLRNRRELLIQSSQATYSSRTSIPASPRKTCAPSSASLARSSQRA